MPYADRKARRRYFQHYNAERPSRDRSEGHRPLRGRPPQGDERKVLVNVRLPVSMVARLQRTKEEGLVLGKYPWKTLTAVIEGLLLRGMESMKGDPLFDEMLPYLRVVQQIDGVGSHRREAQAAMNKVRTEISELLAIKAVKEATQYYHATWQSIEEMSPNVWRDWLLDQMRKAFPKLARSRPQGVTLAKREGKDVASTLLATRPSKSRRAAAPHRVGRRK